MSSRRTTSRRVGTGAALTVLLLSWPGVAAADAPARTGWWNAASANGVALPLPTTGADALHVGQGPNGPSAYAAVAYDLVGQAVSGATLELKVVPNSSVGTVVLIACPTKDLTWKAGGNQPYDARPLYDCAKGVRGLVAADATKVTFQLNAAQLLAGSGYSLAIVPSPTADPFTVDFAKPDATSLAPQVAPAPTGGPPSGPATAPPPYVPPPAASGSVPLPAGPIAAPPALPVPGPAVALPAVPAPQAAPAPAPPTALARRPVEPVSNRDRYAAGSLLALLAGALVWAFQQPAPAPRLLGGLARKAGPQAMLPLHAKPRGIGRFATMRTRPARPLL